MVAGQGQFQYLFTPLKVGAMTVPNRILMLGHATGYFNLDALPTERAVDYLLARARGGAGLLITAPHHVLPLTSVAPPGPIHDDRAIKPLSRIADAIHEHGTKLVAQLCHMGGYNTSGAYGGVVMAPSPVTRRGLLPGLEEMPHEMDIDEIKVVVEAFGSMASRMRKAGFDGVEIQAMFGFLIPQFWSPLSNLRSDEYGGSLENRLRFALEVVDSVRAAVGRDFTVGIRVDGDEFSDGGLTLDDMKVITAKLAVTGKLDYISVCAGLLPSLHVPPMYFPLGVYTHLSAAIKEVTNLPVFTAGRINDPVLAEKVLAEGRADMIGMARGLICDPELPNKAREGRLDEIRRCLGCVECGRKYFIATPLSCTFNPEAGREREFAVLPAATKKKVMVVGGGAAGLETARVAALRGHQVSLYEKGGELGGQVNIAAKAPGREDFAEVTRYYTYQMKLLGVGIHLSTEVTIEMVEKENPDAVVVATGSQPFIPPFPGANTADVVEVRAVLGEKVAVGEKVVLVSLEHYMPGLSTADFLAERGKKVEFLTDAIYAGAQVDSSTIEVIYRRLLSKGVTITPLTRIKEIQGNTVLTFNVLTNTERLINGVDTVVVSTGGRADDALYCSLKGKVKELYAVGHCLSPRRLLDSILDGARVGRLL
jgi:2,4-dienoyl-CoA reductase-like NADH-dependent reductase (Old Yellow Enzyme family)/thioredoxin reductase